MSTSAVGVTQADEHFIRSIHHRFYLEVEILRALALLGSWLKDVRTDGSQQAPIIVNLDEAEWLWTTFRSEGKLDGTPALWPRSTGF